MTGGRHVEGHRLSNAIAVHQIRELEIDVDSGSVCGTVLNFNPSVVSWNEFADGGKWGDPLFDRNQHFETHRRHRDAAHTSIVGSLSVAVVGGEGCGESVVLVGVEQVPNNDAGLVGRRNPQASGTILRPGCGLVDVREQ